MEQDNLLQTEDLQDKEVQSSGATIEEPQAEAPVQEESAPVEKAPDENPTSVEKAPEENPTPVEKTPEKEVPAWDFNSFGTEEIISRMKELIEEFPVQQLKVLDSLPAIFENRYKEEHDKALAAFTEDGSSADDFEYANDTKERFYNIYRLYREKKAEHHKKMEEEKEENLRTKLQIIEDLKALCEQAESPNKTFQEFKALQEKWRNTGMVPQAQANDVLENYHLQVENFYNNIKINRELRDLDLKKNLEAKTALCEQAEKLLEENDIGNAFRQLQYLHQQWKEIGPVAADQKEPIWERFKATTGKINDNYHHFLDSLKEEQENNLKAKEELCVKLEAIVNKERGKHSEWEDAAKRVMELQEEWKHAGLVPQKERNKIMKRFRSLCDTFFDQRRAFLKELDKIHAANLKAKTALCEQAEALKESTDWKATARKLIDLQKQWKETGPVQRKHSEKIWRRFRAACDYFFERKNAQFKDRHSEEQKNLEAKKALIEELRNFQFADTTEATIEALKNFQNRWAEIGFVPFKEKENVQNEFRNLINSYYDKLDMDDFDKTIELFKSKLNTFEASGDKDSRLVEEREKLVNRIKQVENDLHVWENNIGFFSKSGNASSVIKEFENKIEGARRRLALMNEKLRIIDCMI